MWKKYGWKVVDVRYDINYLKIPVNNVPINDIGKDVFNELFLHLKQKEWSKIVRTPSGGISIARKNFRPPMWDVKVERAFVEITVIAEVCYRLQFSNFAKVEDNVSGRQSFKYFKQICEKYGVNIDEMAIDNGEEIKPTIEKAKIQLFGEPERIYDRVHHIDLNSSHISGMVKYYPDLKKPFEEIYNKRKTDEKYKHILTHTWGYMQSKWVGYKWAHISRDGMKYTNERMEELSNKLRSCGRRIIAYNTDGIWYQGEIYHDDTEGKELGMWKNDHINCTFRAKSKGAYEFIEDGKYTPVVRGACKLDKLKPRDQWEWGDIFRKDPQIMEFYWDDEKGIVSKEDM